jgi:uncharacterized membrane protein YgcG
MDNSRRHPNAETRVFLESQAMPNPYKNPGNPPQLCFDSPLVPYTGDGAPGGDPASQNLMAMLAVADPTQTCAPPQCPGSCCGGSGGGSSGGGGGGSSGGGFGGRFSNLP